MGTYFLDLIGVVKEACAEIFLEITYSAGVRLGSVCYRIVILIYYKKKGRNWLIMVEIEQGIQGH